MPEAKYPLWLLTVALLVVSCRGSVAGEGVRRYENAASGDLQAAGFIFNATNVTHLICGITANVAAALLYGSNFVPVRRIETGDGMFFQWVACAAIWVVSMAGNVILESPKFYPFAMIGGALWATGTIAVVPVIKAIGLALGILIWGSSSSMMGWASSRFGWFGVDIAAEVSRPILNYCGAGLCVFSGLIFMFVKPDVQLHPNSESIPLLIDELHRLCYDSAFHHPVPDTESSGCLLAAVLGLLYGSSLIPILYIKSHSSCHGSMFYGASFIEADYIFALCSGIFVASTVYFAIYCAAMNNRPRVYSRAILPGLLAGIMWALGTYCWVLANNYLSAFITYPTVNAGNGLVGALWGSLVFREVRGFANCAIFFFAICAMLMGSLLMVFSKF